MQSVWPRVGLIFLLPCAAISLANAASIKLDGSCSYFGEALPPKAEMVSSTDEVGTLIQRIVDVSGLSRNFEVRAALVPNAVAMNLGSTRYILYNPRFIQDVSNATGSRWAAIGILAHEVGHHLNGHTLISGGSRPPLELQADYFSGFILEKLGATLEDATAAIEKFAPQASGPTHPARLDRVASIKSGWMSACKKDANCANNMEADGKLQIEDDPGNLKDFGIEKKNRALTREAQ